jgi:hypothetical protein
MEVMEEHRRKTPRSRWAGALAGAFLLLGCLAWSLYNRPTGTSAANVPVGTANGPAVSPSPVVLKGSVTPNAPASLNGPVTAGAPNGPGIAPATNAPAAPPALPTPANLRVTLISSSQVDLSWTYDGPAPARWEVWRKQGQGRFRLHRTTNPQSQETGRGWSCSDSDIAAGGQYVYKVRAIGKPGESLYSGEVSAGVQSRKGAGELELSDLALEFGEIQMGASGEKSLTLQNTGKGLLTGQVRCPDGPFQAHGEGSFSLAPGKSATITVVFHPRKLGDTEQTLEITSNDPVLPAVRVQLTGTARTDAPASPEAAPADTKGEKGSGEPPAPQKGNPGS